MPVYRDDVPEHLMTVAQLRRSGWLPAELGVPGGWWEREFEGDLWRTPLYDVRLATPITSPVPASLPATSGQAARQDAALWAGAALRDDRMVVLDTELTDFQGRVNPLGTESILNRAATTMAARLQEHAKQAQHSPAH